MELISFIFLLILGSVTIVTENKKFLQWVYIPFLIFFMIVVRFSGLEWDMNVYAIEMKSKIHTLYYLREFVFWYSLRFLYTILNNELSVFFLMDLIWIYTLYRISFNLSVNSKLKNNLSIGLIVILSTSFPMFFGYENIYRQLFATLISLYSYSIIQFKYKQSIFLFLISIFIHNSVLVLLPIFLVNRFLFIGFYFRVLISLFVSLCFVFILRSVTQFKSNLDIQTGDDVGSIYFIMFLICLFVYLIKFKFRVFDLFRKLPSLVVISILITGLNIFKFGIAAERLGMIFLIYLLFDLYRYSNNIENYINRMFFRLSLLLIFSLPVLVFSSSRSFLLNLTIV